MEEKVLSMREAISQFVKDGDSVVMGAALESLIPFSAGHEIIRQNKKGLELICPISDILFDQLIGAGCVRKVTGAWIGNVIMGSAYNFRRAVEEGIPNKIELEDHSNLTIGLALHAGSLGIPYIPTRTALGSGLMRGNPNLISIKCPFTGEKLAAVKAKDPDVSILYAQRADKYGNAHLWGNAGFSVDAANAGKKIILVAEELVSSRIISSDPNRTLIPGFLVSALVIEPFSAHPSSVQGYWNRDHKFYIDYHEETKTVEQYNRWLEHWVLGVKDRKEYMRLLGKKRVDSLKVKKSAFSAVVDFGY